MLRDKHKTGILLSFAVLACSWPVGYWMISSHTFDIAPVYRPIVMPWNSTVRSDSALRASRLNKTLKGHMAPRWNKKLAFSTAWGHMTLSWNSGLTYSSNVTHPDRKYKAPCWEELITMEKIEAAYTNNDYSRVKAWSQTVTGPLIKAAADLKAIYNRSRLATHLRCLPSLYIIGTPKSGTTDIFSKVIQHPKIVTPVLKETWYPHNRDAINFKSYLELFDPVANKIREDPSLITVDGNLDLYRSYNWTRYPSPAHHTPLLYLANIRAINPKARFVLLVREPFSRIMSFFKMWVKNTARAGVTIDSSPAKFHRLIQESIATWNKCMTHHASPRVCARVPATVSRFYNMFRSLIYYVYVEEIQWIIPNSHLLIVRGEDYYEDRGKVLNAIYKMLGLKPLSPDDTSEMSSANVSNPANHMGNFTVLPETEKLFRDFIEPYNAQLASILKDPKFLW